MPGSSAAPSPATAARSTSVPTAKATAPVTGWPSADTTRYEAR